MKELLIAIISLFLGAFLQYFFTGLMQRQQSKNKRLADACIEYLDSVAEVTFCNLETSNKSTEKLLKAKSKIILLGSQQLIELLYRFEKTNKIFDNDTTKNVFLMLITEMRLHIFKGKKVEEGKIKVVLFGSEKN